MLVLIVMAVLWFAPQMAYSLATPGNGPGGVGVTDGSSTLELWLRADRGVFSDSGCTTAAGDGNSVGCWQDQSGNNADGKQQGAIGVPTFDSNPTPSVNGKPVVNFTGSQILESPSVTLSDLSVFVVFNASNDGMVYEHNNRGVESFGSNLYTGQTCAITVNRNGTETNKSGTSASWGAGNVNRIVTQAYNGTHLGHTLSINNSLLGLANCNQNGDPLSDPLSRGIYIGGRANLSCCGLNGNIAEMIFYSEDLPAVQKILVENYLSSKYSIDFDITSTNDHYDGDTPANGDFDLDVAGIGRFGGVSHIEARAAGMVVVNGTFLNADGDWLLFGHNVSSNGNTNTLLPTEDPWDTAPDPARWGRSWYIDVTDAGNNGGTVNITFDFNEGGMGNFTPSDANPSNYRLIKRSAIGNPYTDVAGASSVDVANKRVTFTGVNVTVLGSDFTLGTLNNNNSPTAVSLQQPINITSQPSGLLVIAACVLTLGVGSLWVCLRHRPE